jgi:predicted TIM-barrel fold metal-dependent hydrolase
MEPDDKMARFNVEQRGAEKLVWAYHYPHSDSVTEPKVKLDENLASRHATQRESIIGSTAIALYGL